MKRILSSILLLVLLVNMLSSYRVYLEHYINFDQIVNTLCEQKFKVDNDCQGKCHLKKEVEKSEEESNNKKEEKKNNFELNEFLNNEDFVVFSNTQIGVLSSFDVQHTIQPYITVETTPPIC